MRLDGRDWDLLRALCELRYLSVSQIQRLWFEGAALATVRRRMWQLGKEGFVRRLGVVEAVGLPWLSVYRLTRDGVAAVRNRGYGAYDLYDDVGVHFLRHLVDTNEVFLALASTAAWQALPFVWLGSHRSRLSFVQIVADPRGGPSRQRQRVLAPDALVTPRHDVEAPRCFLELDRVTEALASGPGHNSIERKLRAYRGLIIQLVPGESQTAYARAFRRNPRPARLVFVVATADRRQRRVASILEKARAVTPELDVRAMPLSDLAAIRSALLPANVTSASPRPSPPRWGETTLNQVVELRDAYVEAASDLRNAADTRPDCHDRLKRLAVACRGLALRAKDLVDDAAAAAPVATHNPRTGG